MNDAASTHEANVMQAAKTIMSTYSPGGEIEVSDLFFMLGYDQETASRMTMIAREEYAELFPIDPVQQLINLMDCAADCAVTVSLDYGRSLFVVVTK